MNKKCLDEIEIRLKIPIVALGAVIAEKSLPKALAKTALEELKKSQAIVKKLRKKIKTKP